MLMTMLSTTAEVGAQKITLAIRQSASIERANKTPPSQSAMQHKKCRKRKSGPANGDGKWGWEMGLGNGEQTRRVHWQLTAKRLSRPQVMHASSSGAGKGAALLSFAKLLVYFKASNSWSISCVMAQNNAVNLGVAAIAQRHQHCARGALKVAELREGSTIKYLWNFLKNFLC